MQDKPGHPAQSSWLRSFVFVVVVTCLPSVVQASLNLVVNGDFETPKVQNQSDAFDVYYGGSSFEGWSVGGYSVDIVGDNSRFGNWWIPASGHQSVDLNGYGPGLIAQALNTTPGQTYYLSFAMAGNPFASVVAMDFFWDNALVNTLYFNVSNDRADLGWRYYQFALLAPTDFAELRFSSAVPTGPNGPALDDVVVSDMPRLLPENPPPGPTPVPEPSTYLAAALLVLPFIFHGLLGKSWASRVQEQRCTDDRSAGAG